MRENVDWNLFLDSEPDVKFDIILKIVKKGQNPIIDRLLLLRPFSSKLPN